MRLTRTSILLTAFLAVALGCAALAMAAAPSNDTRPNAQQLQLGQTVNGTTTEATSDDDDASGCGPSDTPSVWYRLDANTNGRAIVQLQAAGDLDVVVDVYQRVRSQFDEIVCDESDKRGRASTEFTLKKGQSYLIRVTEKQQSVSGDFTLLVGLGQPEATPPGRPLPSGGGSGTVQRVFEPSNSWSTRMREGVTYRINLSPASCTRLSIYGPGTSSFDEESRRVLTCGGYTLFTPGPHESGVYSLLVQPNSSRRTPQRYRLQVHRAGRDDTSPGKFIRNHTRLRGLLNANRIDVVDLYRFDVAQPSITDLVMKTGADFDVILVSAGGRRLASGGGGGGDQNIHVRTMPGRYFVLVRAHRHAVGRYRLTRASKTITRTTLSPSPRVGSPGGNISLRVGVTPSSVGRVTVFVERFDPVSGWQFARRFETRISGSSTAVSFNPPGVGRYRAQATFNGTRIAAGSRSSVEHFRVEGPLEE